MTNMEKLTKVYFEKQGCLVGSVAHYNHYSRRHHDLFGIFDLIVVGFSTFPTTYVQATAGSDHASRRRKMLASDSLQPVIAAGNGVALVSWRKPSGSRLWKPRIELFSSTGTYSP